MLLERLQLEDFRLFERLELELAPGLNTFTGDNGAGKTSVLEAVHLLAWGRSFRGSVRDGLIRRQQSALKVFAIVSSTDGGRCRLGIERGARGWQARIDGQSAAALSEVYRHVAAITFEPGSHELISGGSEHRRRFLDWALFHVEPGFLENWRRFQRALKQRNALLRSGGATIEGLDIWERELAESGERLSEQRVRYLDRLLPLLRRVCAQFLPELGEVGIRFSRGWSREHDSLAAALEAARPRDLIVGHGSVGPHRADWSLGYEHLPTRDIFSRGQGKLSALAATLAQAALFAEDSGFWPILCLDDLASELDRNHLDQAMAWLEACPAQMLLTGTALPERVASWPGGTARFHVEQGRVKRLL